MRTFLVGDRVTIADISLATELVEIFKLLLDGSVRAKLTNLLRWHKHICSLAPFKTVCEEI
jgi:elongation factor 1-gamma